MRIGVDLTAGIAVLLAVALATWWLFQLPASYLAWPLAAYLVCAGLLAAGLQGTLGGPGIGEANRVTLFRATLVFAVAGMIGYPEALSTPGLWWIIVLSTAALILDGFDGWAARRYGATQLGARFDMELDAFLILVLALLVWRSGRTGPWVILIGAMRYLFIVAGWAYPKLRSELPESSRRKTICVIQGIALLVCLGPIIPLPLPTAAAAIALTLLVYSFGLDVLWLRANTGAGSNGTPPRRST